MMFYLLLGVTYAFAAAIQPGPFQSYLISQTLSNGWRRTLPAAFAPLLSDGPVIVVVVILLSSIPEWFVNVLQCVGGIFLLYLAVDALKAWRNYSAESVIHSSSSRQSLMQAAVVNFLNPGPYLGWSLVMGPLLLKGWRETPVNGIALLAGFYISMIVSLMGIILLFAFAKTLGPRVTRALIGVSMIALACFGIYQFWFGIKYFLQ
jgi:threonine/homoserine/homoserine lactone efflux protein